MMLFIIYTLIISTKAIIIVKKPPRIGTIPITKDGFVVLVSNRTRNMFSLPFGRMDEDALQTAKIIAFKRAGVGGYMLKEPVLVYKNIIWFFMIVKAIKYRYPEFYRGRVFIKLDSIWDVKKVNVAKKTKYILMKLMEKKGIFKLKLYDKV